MLSIRKCYEGDLFHHLAVFRAMMDLSTRMIRKMQNPYGSHPQRPRLRVKSGRESPWGHCLIRTVSEWSQSFWRLTDARNLCVFLPNQSEVCFRSSPFVCFNTEICIKFSCSPCLFGSSDQALLELKSSSLSA